MINPSSQPPVAYIDANIFKFSATALPRLFPRKQIIDWPNGVKSEHNYYDLRCYNPNERIKSPRLRSEVELIPAIAERVKVGKLLAVVDWETQFETWGLPNMDSALKRFYGAEVGMILPPIPCNRLMFCAGHDPLELQRHFLRGIHHPRYLELQRLTGGY